MTTLKKTERYKLVLTGERNDHRVLRRDGALSYIYAGTGGQVFAKKLLTLTDEDFNQYCEHITFNKILS